MDFLFSLLWYLLVGKFIKDKPTVQTKNGQRDANQDFILLHDLDNDGGGGIEKPESFESNDPFLNGESTDGPEW